MHPLRKTRAKCVSVLLNLTLMHAQHKQKHKHTDQEKDSSIRFVDIHDDNAVAAAATYFYVQIDRETDT